MQIPMMTKVASTPSSRLGFSIDKIGFKQVHPYGSLLISEDSALTVMSEGKRRDRYIKPGKYRCRGCSCIDDDDHHHNV